MQPREVAAAVLRCRGLPKEKPPLTRADLSAAEVDAVGAKLLEAAALPEGWFYDGRMYIDSDGAKSAEHPSLAAAVVALLAEKNAAVEQHNAAVRGDAARAAAEEKEFMLAVNAMY